MQVYISTYNKVKLQELPFLHKSRKTVLRESRLCLILQTSACEGVDKVLGSKWPQHVQEKCLLMLTMLQQVGTLSRLFSQEIFQNNQFYPLESHQIISQYRLNVHAGLREILLLGQVKNSVKLTSNSWKMGTQFWGHLIREII